MKTIKIPYSSVPQLSNRDITYIEQAPNLRPFFKYTPELSSFEQVINDKSQEAIPREQLVATLKKQYASLDIDNEVGKNILSLADSKTFTVTTAHQPSLMTGPLYYIYKIFSVIHLAKKLQAAYPGYNFVPLFVTGGEDHDFEEVNHFRIFGQELTWNSDEKGSVGTFKTDCIHPVIDALLEKLGQSENAEFLASILEKSHKENKVYSAAVIEMVHELFKGFGLVILNMNQSELKRLFIPILKQELFDRPSEAIVNETISELEDAGYKAQAKPRELNLFYLKPQIRERIVFENDRFTVLNTNYSFSEQEMQEELENHPERFSPNVMIRPLFQEFILPNLAYVGGGGEIAYWLERKKQFEYFNINFPMLIRRNSVLWIDRQQLKKMNKLDLNVENLFLDTDSLVRDYINKHSKGELSLESEKEVLKQIFGKIFEKAETIDPTLAKKFEAEKVRQLKNMDQMEGRLIRAEKQKHETAINQIKALKEKLFPQNGLQERYDNFISYYIRNGADYFDTLSEALDPLDSNFVVLLED